MCSAPRFQETVRFNFWDWCGIAPLVAGLTPVSAFCYDATHRTWGRFALRHLTGGGDGGFGITPKVPRHEEMTNNCLMPNSYCQITRK